MRVYERRRAIIEALCLCRHDVGRNLAFEFGVSIRTIYYDIAVLTPYYPLYTKPGYGGGIFIAKGYKLDRKYLTDAQAELLEELISTLSGDKAEIIKSILKTFKQIKD